MRGTGKIASWNDEKGFGFITPGSGAKKVFVHIKAFSNRTRRPAINQSVTYLLSTDKQGRACAVKALLAGDNARPVNQHKSTFFSVFGAIAFLVIVGGAVVMSRLPLLILAIYIAASLFTFIVYALDKSAAKRNAWRTKESTLHLLALAGGWPGALIAQQKLRHKSKKKDFRAIFWTTVLLNSGAFLWLLTPAGANKLQSLLVKVAVTLPIGGLL